MTSYTAWPSNYLDAIANALPAGVRLLGSEFVGPVVPCASAELDMIDYWGTVARHDFDA